MAEPPPPIPHQSQSNRARESCRHVFELIYSTQSEERSRFVFVRTRCDGRWWQPKAALETSFVSRKKPLICEQCSFVGLKRGQRGVQNAGKGIICKNKDLQTTAVAAAFAATLTFGWSRRKLMMTFFSVSWFDGELEKCRTTLRAKAVDKKCKSPWCNKGARLEIDLQYLACPILLIHWVLYQFL